MAKYVENNATDPGHRLESHAKLVPIVPNHGDRTLRHRE